MERSNTFKSWSLYRLIDCTRGVSLIETALCMPFLVLLGLGGLELANLALAYMRVHDIAIKVADNAARVRISIDETDVNEIFVGTKEMGKPLGLAQNGRIILSSIEPVMDALKPTDVVNQYIRWQRCTGASPADSSHGSEGDGATGTAQSSGYGIPGGPKITASANNAVMLAEVIYHYQPLVGDSVFGKIDIRAAQAITVRQRKDQVLKNAGRLSDGAKSLCTNPHTA